MRREGSGVRPAHLGLALLLLLPPFAHVAWSLSRSLREPRVEDLSAQRESLLAEIQVLQDAIARQGGSLVPTLHDPQGRYDLLAADVLPLADPTPQRSALWLFVRDRGGVDADTAVVHSGALVGRVIRAFGRIPIASAQTILDPEFRVRFRSPGASGMLRGTGRLADGRPVLEMQYVSEEAEFHAGEKVVTEGRDGVYPTGVLIGRLDRDPRVESSAAAEKLVVHAAARVGRLWQVHLADDQARRAARQLQAAKGRRP